MSAPSSTPEVAAQAPSAQEQAVAQAPAPAAYTPAPPAQPSASLYVGELDPTVTGMFLSS